jgi:hypothetical protein
MKTHLCCVVLIYLASLSQSQRPYPYKAAVASEEDDFPYLPVESAGQASKYKIDPLNKTITLPLYEGTITAGSHTIRHYHRWPSVVHNH